MRAALLLLLVGCGRLGFDTVSPTDDAPSFVGDGASDGVLATCATDARYTSNMPGNKYRRVVGDASWADAQATCVADGAHLPILDDQIEASSSLIGDWLGITDALVEGEWRTVNGDLATFLPWGPNQPDGGTADNCGRLDDATGLIETQACTELRDFSCECETGD